MNEQVNSAFDTKQIHELNPLSKLSGKEELLIDDGNGTLRVTVDTMLGYIRDQINMSGGNIPVPTESSVIHIIQKDEQDIPVESRQKGHYYIKIVDAIEAQLSTGLPRVIKVSPNMGLRLITE